MRISASDENNEDSTVLTISNPKQDRRNLKGREAWYPYYAGFSAQFARELLQSAQLPKDGVVLDPWNGAGTTTSAATDLRIPCLGVDLNPAMVVAARARSLSIRELNSLKPIGRDVVSKAREATRGPAADPLDYWFIRSSATAFRQLELAIQKLLVDPPVDQEAPTQVRDVDALSDLASFFYTALFRSVRRALDRFIPTNPTWTKLPESRRHRLRPNPQAVFSSFLSDVSDMCNGMSESSMLSEVDVDVAISLGSSENLALSEESVDFVLTSPPYCTRIDYAVATLPELAVLGYDYRTSFHDLRRSLIGKTVIGTTSPEPADSWGEGCLAFLEKVSSHRSKASASYYLKSYLDYFAGIHQSLSEIVRVSKRGARISLVVQDSYYKDIHNDLPLMTREMMRLLGAPMVRESRFPTRSTMANLNPNARKYRTVRRTVETVQCFIRN
jgi:DNA modification methylase